MIRIVSLLMVLFLPVYSSACEKPIDPATDCWNPPSRHVTSDLKRFYAIDSDISEALFINDLKTAESLAEEYLRLAEKFRKNWNYGNAVHDANITLGTVQVRKGKFAQAGKYLVAAGKSTGSPQLDSFGPDLMLAKVLLKKGQDDSVKLYLLGVQNFWEMDEGKVAKWLGDLERGERPDLSRY